MATDDHGMQIPVPPDSTKVKDFPKVTRDGLNKVAEILAGGITPAVMQAVIDAAGPAVDAEVEALGLLASLNGGVQDAAGGIVDADERLTWLTHTDDGGPTAYALSKLLPALEPSIAAEIDAAAAPAVAAEADRLGLLPSVNGHAPTARDAVGGIIGALNALTWLTHTADGGPTAYALSKLLPALQPGIAQGVLAAGVGELTARGIAGGFVDSTQRETELVFDYAGKVPARVLNAWRDRMGTTGGLVTTTTRSFWGHSMAQGTTNGATPISTYLAALLGKPVNNFGIGGEKSDQILARVLANQANRADVTYLWPARNDLYKAGYTPELAVYRTRRMLEHQTAVRRKTLIFEEPPFGDGEAYGQPNRASQLDAYNNAIKAAFPDVWVPLASWMLTQAAADSVGYTFTADDLTDISNGLTPRGFRSDTGHYNSLGNQAAANRIFQEEQLRGWI